MLAMKHATTTVEHPRDARDPRPYIATCSCGWRSSRQPTVQRAEGEAWDHVFHVRDLRRAV